MSSSDSSRMSGIKRFLSRKDKRSSTDQQKKVSGVASYEVSLWIPCIWNIELISLCSQSCGFVRLSLGSSCGCLPSSQITCVSSPGILADLDAWDVSRVSLQPMICMDCS